MHHPDIHDILSIIKDYSILTSSNFKLQIDPTIYKKPYDPSKPNEDIRECHGLKIIHQLNQGRIEINITGSCDDYDCMDAQYFGNEDLSQLIENIGGFAYYRQSARDAIRKIMILDRDRNNKANSQ